jgi:hypothetical protein
MGVEDVASAHARKGVGSGPSWSRLLGGGVFVAGWALIAWSFFSK